MIRIAVCDDEQCFVEQIYTILSVQAKEISSALHISTYMDSGQLLYDVEDGVHFDLLFLDIEMPGTDGMSLAGANCWAADGADYRAILTHYYPGVLVEKR